MSEECGATAWQAAGLVFKTTSAASEGKVSFSQPPPLSKPVRCACALLPFSFLFFFKKLDNGEVSLDFVSECKFSLVLMLQDKWLLGKLHVALL